VPDDLSLEELHEVLQLVRFCPYGEGEPMKFRIQVVRVADHGAERTREMMEFDRQELAMETLGMSLAEGNKRWWA
jgi:hypothetical protein